MRRVTAILIMAFVLTAYSAVHASAWSPPVMNTVDSLEKLEQLNESSAGADYIIEGTINVNKKVELSFEHSIVLFQDSIAGSTIVIEEGGELVIDAPEVREIYTTGNFALINVKPGGKLVLKRGAIPGTAIRDGIPTVVVEDGGVCELYNNFEIMLNVFHTFEDAISGEITRIDDSLKSDSEGGKPVQHEEKDIYTGRVVYMDKEHQISMFFTVPELTRDISSIRVERKNPYIKTDTLWETLCTYEREKDNETPENIVFKHIVPKNNPADGEYPFIEYFSWNQNINGKNVSNIRVPDVWNKNIAGKTVTYRMVYEYDDKTKADFETCEIDIVMPENENEIPYTSGEEYGDIGGNRSGIVQGESERIPPGVNNPETEIKPEIKPVLPVIPSQEQKTDPEDEKILSESSDNEGNKAAGSEKKNIFPEMPDIKGNISEPEVKKEVREEPVFYDDNTSMYKDVVSATNAIPGIVIATTATIGIAGSAYGVTRVIKRRKSK